MIVISVSLEVKLKLRKHFLFIHVLRFSKLPLMELGSDSSSWLSSIENLYDPLFSSEFMHIPFPESSLSLDFGFSGSPKEESPPPDVAPLQQHNPPAPLEANRMHVDNSEESVSPATVRVSTFPFPGFVPSGFSLPGPTAGLPPPDLSVPTRKRRKRDSAPNLLPPPSQVSNLVKLEGVVDAVDSNTFESFLAGLRNFRSLSSSEELFVKKVTKKIKNRESARKSRQAKKDHNADLETRVSDLVDLTQELKIVRLVSLHLVHPSQQVATLESENRQIRNEISFTENLIISHPLLSKLYFMSAQRFPLSTKPEANVSSQPGRPILAF